MLEFANPPTGSLGVRSDQRHSHRRTPLELDDIGSDVGRRGASHAGNFAFTTNGEWMSLSQSHTYPRPAYRPVPQCGRCGGSVLRGECILCGKEA